jgi:NADPH:quinone reductase-like Zn-dependent oxidoreductase
MTGIDNNAIMKSKMNYMKAIILKEAGDANQLQLAQVSIPSIGDDEVLIRAKAISINPVDIKTRIGKSLYHELKESNDEIILGWDVSGIIVQVGKRVTEYKEGAEVFGMVNFPGHGKAYAEYVAAQTCHLALKPSNISHAEAAAATLAALTAWQALVTHGKVQSGQKVVIQAAAGGVGHFAVQIAKYLGAYVIASTSAVNREFVLELGADEHIDYKKHPIDELVHDADFVLDPVGGDNIDHSLNAVKKGGKVIVLPSMYKDLVERKAKEKGVNGLFFSVASDGSDMKAIAELLKKGIIHSHIAQTFAFEQMADAHRQIETGRTKGKIVVFF